MVFTLVLRGFPRKNLVSLVTLVFLICLHPHRFIWVKGKFDQTKINPHLLFPFVVGYVFFPIRVVSELLVLDFGYRLV